MDARRLTQRQPKTHPKKMGREHLRPIFLFACDVNYGNLLGTFVVAGSFVDQGFIADFGIAAGGVAVFTGKVEANL